MANYSQPHICQCLSRLSTLRRHSPVTVSGDRRRTGPEFVDAVLGLARGLLGLGISSGDVVAVAALNSDLYLEWLLAIAFVGGIIAPLNYRWSFEEALFAVEAVRPVMLVTDESCEIWSSKLQNFDLPFLRWHVSLHSSASDLLRNSLSTETIKKHSSNDSSLDYSWAPDGAILICFTSGTTGRPKGVTISHSALIIQSLAKIALVGYSEDDVYLHTAPLCHIGGLSSAISMLLIGACHILIPKFEAKSALEATQKYNVTSLITVPAMMADLISSARDKKQIESVNKILNGGGGLSVELTKEAIKLFPRAKLLSAYGMTEACSSLTFMTLCDQTLGTRLEKTKPISVRELQGICVGKPAPHVELKILLDDSCRVGRILTRGPHVMLGYWEHGSIKSASNSMNQNWLDTGDIGYLDDHGNLWLIGRTKGRIKSGGENVYPEEVEAVLSQHPGVVGVVTVGIPNARLTEMVVACIQIGRDWQWSNRTFEHSTAKQKHLLSHEILQKFCNEKNLSRFKIPKKFMLWNKPFPLTTTGKIRRELVQQEVVSQLRSLHSNL